MDYQLSFRSRGSLGSFLFTVGAVSLFVLIVLVADGTRELARALPLGAVVIIWAWWRWWWPRLEVASGPEGGLMIRNQLRTLTVPWRSVSSVYSHLGLFVHCRLPDGEEKKIYVAAVPSKASIRSAKIQLETPPPLVFTKGNPQTLWVGPFTAQRMLEEELLFSETANLRPELSLIAQKNLAQAKAGSQLIPHSFPGKTVSRFNLLPVLLQSAALLWAAAALLL